MEMKLTEPAALDLWRRGPMHAAGARCVSNRGCVDPTLPGARGAWAEGEDVVHGVPPLLGEDNPAFMALEMNGSPATLPRPRRRVVESPAPRRYRRRDSRRAHGRVDRQQAWDRCRPDGKDSHAYGAGSETSPIPIQSFSAVDGSAIAMRCRVLKASSLPKETPKSPDPLRPVVGAIDASIDGCSSTFSIAWTCSLDRTRRDGRRPVRGTNNNSAGLDGM